MGIITATPTSNTSEKIVVERDKGRNLLLTGELIAKTSSSDNRSMADITWVGCACTKKKVRKAFF